MSTRRASWLAWSLFALAVALGIGFLPLFVAVTRAASAPDTPFTPPAVAALQMSALGWIETPLILLATCTLSALGALIVSRSPAHAIGWIFCAVGFQLVAAKFAGYYAIYALFLARGALPGGLAAGWFQTWIWVVALALLGAFVPLLFPTGRLLSARWKPAWWLAIGATLGGALVWAFALGRLDNWLVGLDVPNPLGVADLGGDLTNVLESATYFLLLASMLVAAASLVVRLRRAQGVERQQIKWFAYFGVAFALFFVLRGVVRDLLGLPVPALVLALDVGYYSAGIGLPIVTGLAILRYRLFDIDVLIRRTLIYSTLTTTLAGVYFAVILGAQGVLQALTGQTGQQPVVIVASTLLVAALFTPLRRGIQAVIDRRFYRRKYDAAKTLAAFGQTLRTETDLAELSEQLVAVVEETMQPATVSLWLRAPARRASNWQTEESPLSPSS